MLMTTSRSPKYSQLLISIYTLQLRITLTLNVIPSFPLSSPPILIIIIKHI